MAATWFEREGRAPAASAADALATAHRARWLDTVLPATPTLVWSGPRNVAQVLATHPGRPTVWLEPDEGRATEGMREGREGLRVIHVPTDSHGWPLLDDPDLQGFGAVVADLHDLHAAPEIVARLLRLATADVVVALVGGPPLAIPTTAAAILSGRSCTIVPQRLRPASWLGVEDGPPPPPERLGDPSPLPPDWVIVLVDPRGEALPGPSVLLGGQVHAATWETELDDIASTILALDLRVDTLHRKQLDMLEQRLAGVTARLERCQRVRDDLDRQLEVIHHSHIWRFTAPMRRLTGLLR